jgi:hypothetical protein
LAEQLHAAKRFRSRAICSMPRAMPLIRILRLGVLASCGWLALAALLWQNHGFLWALLAVIIWAALLRLFQQAVLAHARELAKRKE